MLEKKMSKHYEISPPESLKQSKVNIEFDEDDDDNAHSSVETLIMEMKKQFLDLKSDS